MDLKGIYDKVKLGGFKNPLDLSIESVKAKLDSAIVTVGAKVPAQTPEVQVLLDELALLKENKPETSMEVKSQAAALLDVQSRLSTAGYVKDKYAAAIDSFKIAIENSDSMLSHSNMLSGIDVVSGTTITSIAKLGAAVSKIEEVQGCDISTSVMGALKNATEIINNTTEIIDKLDELIADVEKFIDEVPAEVVVYGNELIQQVASDVEALATAKLAVVNNAIAAGLVELTESPCFSGIFAGIMTDELKGEVTKVTDKIKATKLKSIGG